MGPLITIAIPAYQRPDLLERALRSAFDQSDLLPSEQLEVLVVEDPPVGGATQASADIEQLCRAVTDPRFRYLRNSDNLGLDNWNRCLRESRGHWIILLHDDDWLAPSFVRQCLDLIAANPELKLVGCSPVVERAGEQAQIGLDARMRRQARRVGPFDFLLANPFVVSGVMMDRQLALALGGFSHEWAPTQDSDCWLRFCEAAPVAHLPAALVHLFIGRNTSLNPGVLTGCIVNDFRQRRLILDRHFPRSPWLRWYSRIRPYRQRRFLERQFRVQLPALDADRALIDEGWQPVPVALQWTYVPLRLAMELVALVASRRLKPC